VTAAEETVQAPGRAVEEPVQEKAAKESIVEPDSPTQEEHKYDGPYLTNEEVANLTLKQLQTLCVERNLIARGTKADLRQRLQQANAIL
jgi:hypothetical protein